ncbi:PREDICTED: splicing factor 3B subunit 4-like, partial [Dipodomys ordii]|uniref:Splicing factor 3B subunit 4-like n=1 Tax=Dipodomys ordii TaxID=10020 RepID=A0A1S3GWS8_DIPOR
HEPCRPGHPAGPIEGSGRGPAGSRHGPPGPALSPARHPGLCLPAGFPARESPPTSSRDNPPPLLPPVGHHGSPDGAVPSSDPSGWRRRLRTVASTSQPPRTTPPLVREMPHQHSQLTRILE